jgi:hypothetical protein
MGSVPKPGEDKPFESATLISLRFPLSRWSTTTLALRLDEKIVASG